MVIIKSYNVQYLVRNSCFFGEIVIMDNINMDNYYSSADIMEYKCYNVINLCLLHFLWFLSRLGMRIQVYCNQSLLTTLSMVFPGYAANIRFVLISVCYFIYGVSRLRRRTQDFYLYLFATLSVVFPGYESEHKICIDLC